MDSNNPMLYTRITYVRERSIARRSGKVKIKNGAIMRIFLENIIERSRLKLFYLVIS